MANLEIIFVTWPFQLGVYSSKSPLKPCFQGWCTSMFNGRGDIRISRACIVDEVEKKEISGCGVVNGNGQKGGS